MRVYDDDDIEIETGQQTTAIHTFMCSRARAHTDCCSCFLMDQDFQITSIEYTFTWNMLNSYRGSVLSRLTISEPICPTQIQQQQHFETKAIVVPFSSHVQLWLLLLSRQRMHRIIVIIVNKQHHQQLHSTATTMAVTPANRSRTSLFLDSNFVDTGSAVAIYLAAL